MLFRVVIVVSFGISSGVCALGARRAVMRDANATDWMLGSIVCLFLAVWGVIG